MQVTGADRVRIEPEALQAQSRLLKTLKRVKEYLRTNKSEIKKGVTDCGGEIGDFAFFKIGQYVKKVGFESSTAYMEAIMWDVAVIMGMTARFVPTGLIRVHLDGTHISKAATKDYSDTLIASYQPRQEGESLKLDDAVADEEYATALMHSLVLGQYDHHTGNVIKTRTDELMNFDNSWSLPSNNGFIFALNGMLLASVRPSFLGMPNGLKPLTFAQRQYCKKILLRCRSQLFDLRKYFASFSAKKKMSYLKSGWLNPEKSINCAFERIDRLEKALDSNEINSFRDLVLRTFEDYRISLAAAILNKNTSDQNKVFRFDSRDLCTAIHEISAQKYPFKAFRAIVNSYTHYNEWFNRLREIKALEIVDPRWKKYIEKRVRKSNYEFKGDGKSETYFLNSLKPYFEDLGVFKNSFGEYITLFNDQNYAVDLITRPGKVIIKAHRGELPPYAGALHKKTSEVLEFLKTLEEEDIPFKLVKRKDREREFFSLKAYEFYIEQISGSDEPRFSIVYKTTAEARIIPLNTLDMQAVKLMIPPRVRPITTEVEIKGCIYEAKVDAYNRLLIPFHDGYLPKMTKEEFDEWSKGPMLELDNLVTVGLFQNKCIYEEELPDELRTLKNYLIVQILDKPSLQFKLLIKENRVSVAYDLSIVKDTDDVEEDIFVLTDSEGVTKRYSYIEFRDKVENC